MSEDKITFTGGGRGGRTLSLLTQFKSLPHRECYMPCPTEHKAEELRDRLRGHGWFEPEVLVSTNYGRPITIIEDEIYGEGRIRTIPNETKSYGVMLRKRKS